MVVKGDVSGGVRGGLEFEDIRPRGIVHPDSVFRALTPQQVRQSAEGLQEMVEVGQAYAVVGEGLNGFRFDRELGRVTPTVGANPMETRTVRFLRLKGRRWSPQLADAYGFPFRADQDAAIPFWGDVYVGGEKASEDKLRQLGVEVVKNSDGSDRKYDMASYRYRRKLYLPGEFQFAVVKAHEVVEGEPPSTIIHQRYRVVTEPRTLESHIRRFEPEKSDEVLRRIHSEAEQQLRLRHSQQGIQQDVDQYLADNMTHQYILSLGEYVERRHHTAEVKRACAFTFGGTGSEYYGHLQIIEPGRDPVVADDEVVTKTGKDSRQLSDKGVFVGKRILVEQGAKGIFIDEAHQPRLSDVPIGGCGVEETVRVARDVKLIEEGAVLSEIAVDTVPFIEKSAADRVFAPRSMTYQTHPLMGEGATPGLYVPVTVVVDDTRRLNEVMSNPLTYMKYVTDQYLEGDNRRRAREILAKLEREAVKKPEKDAGPEPTVESSATAIVLYKGGGENEFEGKVGGVSSKEALLLNLMYATAREKHLTTLSRNVGANMRAAIKANLAERDHASIIQNLSPEGGRADTGDFRSTSAPAERMSTIASGINTFGQYMLANQVMPQLTGVTKDQETLYNLWLETLFETVEKAGVNPLQYVRGHDFKQFMVSFLGGAEARDYYHRVNTDLDAAFTSVREWNREAAVQLMGGVMGSLFDEFDSQQKSQNTLRVYDALYESPFARKTVAVNSSQARTEYGLDYFRASDGTMMVTPSQFRTGFDSVLREFQSIPESFFRRSYFDDERQESEYFRRTQKRVTAFLDDAIGALTGENRGMELVGWDKTYVFRHVGGELYSGNDWKTTEPHRPGEEIHLVAEPTEDRRSLHMTDKMLDVLYAEDAEGKRLGSDRNDRRVVAEVLQDLRRTITERDWGAISEDHREDVIYAYDKACLIARLFEPREIQRRAVDSYGLMFSGLLGQPEQTPVNDYHGGETDYMYGRVTKPEETHQQTVRKRYRFDWVDETG